ncbi:MaoC family dehydratase [Rhizobium sp. S95]|uniref:MaoC family dehydratase n=1 Tax=Ciceribacter sichuanensis TaxID=2949647 RepID=A0AAJ1F784_9HYPH|nr:MULTISPECIES: MaoC family dehydratase [unclassified Ciceribacter]MCM2398895.1 MaoC family dehydratase [Ciceribacter sp. S95]MCO5956899.1 MaoC family dehydratase [Ciceribacter sp. S101]
MKMIELYPPGERIATGSKTFTAASIIRFAEKFDPQPFHTDAEAAKNYVFGALCASGWHTCAEWMRCLIDFWKDEFHRLRAAGETPPKLGPSPGFEALQWLKPVYAGDTINYSLTSVESRPLVSRPGLILNMGTAEGFNQNGEPVLRFRSKILEFE